MRMHMSRHMSKCFLHERRYTKAFIHDYLSVYITIHKLVYCTVHVSAHKTVHLCAHIFECTPTHR